ncbi:microtubule binding motor protein [Lithospermum erythrorhizon]|uniref:Microtubule binding motor protein n=1 Tax=Lithospermum erythrorhizon TaxID=34254 RepID=A0AAV3P5A5_LITER
MGRGSFHGGIEGGFGGGGDGFREKGGGGGMRAVGEGWVSVKSPPDAPPLRISISGETPLQRRPPSTSRIKKPTKPSPEKTQLDESSLSNPDLGPFLLKLTRDTIASGDGPNKALDYAFCATSSFEKSVENGEVGLDLVMSLHVVTTIYYSLGRFEEAVEVLERAVKVLEHGNGGCV